MTYSEESWDTMVFEVSKRFSVTADFDFMLFIIGIQEYGQGMRDYSRQEKMDLINLAKCTLLSQTGHLERVDCDEAGWPQFKEIKNIAALTSNYQNALLKRAAFDYLNRQLW
jgi:hypothetical protein